MKNRRIVKQLAAILILGVALAGVEALSVAPLTSAALAAEVGGPAPGGSSLERTVTMMAKVGFASSPEFSADGKRIAYLTNISGSPQVWAVNADGGYPDQVTAFDDPVTNIEWSPDGKWIAVQVAPGGGLNSQIYVVHPDGTGLRRLTEGGKENNWLGRWTPDSQSLAISSNRRSADAMDCWLVDLATGAMNLIARNEGIGRVSDISRDGKYALVERLRSRGDNDVVRVVIPNAAEREESGRADLRPDSSPSSRLGTTDVLVTKHTPPALFADAQFGTTSDVVYLVGNPDRQFEAFGSVKIDGNTAGPFTVIASQNDAELESVRLTHGGSRAVLAWNRAGRDLLSFYNFATREHTTPRPLPGDIAGGFVFAPNDAFFAFTMSGSTMPADIWTMSTATADLRQITRSPHPGVDLSRLVRPELINYMAQDGVPLSGWLYRPNGAQPPYPTVFSFHGGPEGEERPSFNSTYQALLASGMAVFAPNVRGSSGFGKTFVNLDNGPLRVNGVRDIKDSVDALVARKIADPKRLAIMGGSYGGYMVMAGVTEFPDLFAAGADLFGVVNFDTFFKHTEPWMAAISKVEYGDPATQADMLRSLSPINKLDRVKTPLIVLHGANDTNVPVVEAEQIVDSLKQRGVPVEYVLFPDEGHGWRKTNNRIRSTVSIVRFFSERLK